MGVKLIYDYDFARFHTFANRTTTTESGCTFRGCGDGLYMVQLPISRTGDVPFPFIGVSRGGVCVFGCSDAFPDRTWGRD